MPLHARCILPPDPTMPRTADLLRRYRTTLFLVALAVVGSVAVVQTVRLRYLEQRHAKMFEEFGKAQIDFQARIGELSREAARCRPPQG